MRGLHQGFIPSADFNSRILRHAVRWDTHSSTSISDILAIGSYVTCSLITSAKVLLISELCNFLATKMQVVSAKTVTFSITPHFRHIYTIFIPYVYAYIYKRAYRAREYHRLGRVEYTTSILKVCFFLCSCVVD